MSFLKTKKFWIPFSLISGVFVATGLGVGIYQQHQNAINIYEGNSRSEIRTKLRNALNTISPSDIRVNLNASGINRKSLTQTISDSGLYAFNVSSNQLGLSSNVSIPSGIQIEFELDKEKNTLETLNGGVLNIKLIATTPFSNQVETRDIVLNTFKKADEKLTKLVDFSNSNSTLEIKGEENKFLTIEELNAEYKLNSDASTNIANNSISNLSRLLNITINKTTQNSNNENGFYIEGKVKLEKIVKEKDNKIYFYLTSVNNDSLKLANKANNETKQVLFKQIKITNIAASEVIAIPNGYVYPQTSMFAEKLKTSNKSLTITIPTSSQKDSSSNNSVEVNLKPYFVTAPVNSITLSTAIRIVFGSNKDAKVYDTNRVSDVNELNQAGFKFNIYSKRLMKTEQSLSSTDLNGTNKKLETFFKKENFTTPSMLNNEIGMCTKTALSLDKIPATVAISTNNTNSGSCMQTNGNTQNYIMFADYSYTGVDSGNKTLLTPTLSVVHLEKSIKYDQDKK